MIEYMKNKIHKFSLLAALALLPIIFSGCFDPIFFEIRKDVTPEEATVSGVIQQITRFTEGSTEYILCVADNGLRYKNAVDETHGSWSSMSLPFESLQFDYFANVFSGEYPIAVAADSSNIYLASLKFEYNSDSGTNDPSEIIVRTTSSINGSWSKVYSDTSTCFTTNSYYGYRNIDFNLFCTNSPNKEHRYAYIREGEETLYKLSGTSKSKVESDNTCTDTEAAKNWNSAVYYKSTDKVLFFNTTAVTSDETSSEEPKTVYYAVGTALYYSTSLDEPAFSKSSLDVGYTIRCLAVCSDCLLMGRSNTTAGYGGIAKTTLKDGVPEKLSSFASNAAYQLSTSYLITALLNATPEKSESDSVLYAATAIATAGTSSNSSYNNVGLWSYYPSRGNWNRE